jgi:hypothetical protein
MPAIGVIQFASSAARTANGDNHASPITHAWRYRELVAFLYCSASSGTNPALDVTIETYDELSALWFPVASFTQLITTGSEALRVGFGLGKQLSVKWVITGTTPSFTFQVNGILKD